MIRTFTIPGPLKGYRASIRRAHDPAYKAWKESVVLLAWAAGRLPAPSEGCPVRVGVDIRWKAKPRIDWKNVVGALEDAIFPQDRYVFPGRFNVTWNTGQEEMATVYVEWET